MEQAIRTAAASTRIRGRGISADVCVYAFETLRLECDHRTGVVRDRRRRPLSGRQIADLLQLPRETTARVLAVLQQATVGDDALLVATGHAWQLRVNWLSMPPRQGDRSWLATDRPTWRALRKAVRAHDIALGGGRLWHKALGAAICLRYTCAFPETGALVVRQRRGFRELTDADVRQRFGFDDKAWKARRQLLEQAGVLGPVLGRMAFGFRGWDALEGLAGVVDVAGYRPAYRPPAAPATAHRAQRERPRSRPDSAPPSEAAPSRAAPVDNTADPHPVAHRSTRETPRSAHKSQSPPYKDHAREESGLLTSFASQRVQPHPQRVVPVDIPAAGARLLEADAHAEPDQALRGMREHRNAVNAIIAELCAAPELQHAAAEVKRSFGIRTLVGHLRDAGYTAAETRHFVFVDTPLPWPKVLNTDANRAVGTLAWRLRRLRDARPSTAAYRASRDAERQRWRERLDVHTRRSLADNQRHQRNVSTYLALPEPQRRTICTMMREALGSAWRGVPGEADDITACRRRHAQALDSALVSAAGRPTTTVNARATATHGACALASSRHPTA